MSRHHRLRQRLAGQTCYLCRCSRMSVPELIEQIIHGPGRVLYSEYDAETNRSLLCDRHESDKCRRIDEREDRLRAEGYAVTFAETMPGKPYRPGRVTLIGDN